MVVTPLRPDWVTIVVGSNMDTDNPAAADRRSGCGLHLPPRRTQLRRRHRSTCRRVCHFTGLPPTRSRGSGDNLVTSILQEVMADEAATAHKLKFFEGGATPNLAVSVDLPDPDDFFEFVGDTEKRERLRTRTRRCSSIPAPRSRPSGPTCGSWTSSRRAR